MKPRIRVVPYGSKECYDEQHDYMMRSFQNTLQRTLQEKREKGLPIAGYDDERGLAYIEYSDGTRKYAEAT